MKMKITNYILPLFMAVVSHSCSNSPHEQPVAGPESRGVMDIEITEKQGESEDKLKTVRFIVFKDAATLPTFELNTLFEIPDVNSGDNQVSKFKITLEVSKSEGVDDKMVVAIVNEPSQMKTTLDAITGYDALQNLELDFAHFLNSSHNELQSDKTMPMTGVVWTDKVYSSSFDAEADPARITVYRAAALVEVYVRKESGLDIHLGQGTSVKLKNTYDREFFVRNENGSKVFGHIKTVTSGLIDKSWMIPASDNGELPVVSSQPGRKLCRFYTPERTCVASNDGDKLVLELNIVTNEGAIRPAEVVMNKVYDGGLGADVDLDVIRRNNGYRVLATVGAQTISTRVLDWNSEDIEVEF